MHRRTRPFLSIALGAVAALTVAGLVPGGAVAAEAEPVEAAVTVPRVENLPADFIGGVDVSSVLSLEASGVVFRDADGRAADPFAILADSGVTDVRVRVWNDPFDADGNGYGGGNVDVDRAITIGQRATDAGLGVLVDFHYSDFWADPAKQQAPKAWAGLGAAETAERVGEFTRDALHRIVAAGVDLRMVQVGNETNNGVAGVTGWNDMASVFAAGSAAVRAEAPDALVAVHFTNPERAGFYANVAAELDARGVDYDVFASSYYPFWHGTPANLTAVLKDIADTYGKKVMVAETSWAFTLEDGDGHGNVIDLPAEATQHSISRQGQADAMRAVVQAVADVGAAGVGVFYWEPAWLPVGEPDAIEQNRVLWERDGSGWATSAAGEYEPDDAGQWHGGSAWDNQALFDFDGTASDVLNIFSYVRTGAVAPRQVDAVETLGVRVTAGDAIALPDEVTVRYTDGTSETQAVSWSGAEEFIEGVGEYVITGLTSAGLAASATVSVVAQNFVVNGGFESEDVGAWIVEGEGLALRAWDDPHSGTHSAHFYAASDFAFALSQTVTGLPEGTYVARAALQGDGEGPDGRVALTLSTAGVAADPVDFALAGWREWSTPTTAGVQVGADGSAVVRIEAQLPAGAWGTIDDIELLPLPEPGADTAQLRAQRDFAAAVDPADYADGTATGLTAVIERADIVLAAESPRAEAVDGALMQLNTALDALIALDAATAKPARGVLSHDNGHDTGLRDGDYVITMNTWWGENATKLRLFENGVQIASVPLAYGGSAAQTARIEIAGNSDGSYEYTGELVNSQGVTALEPVTVTVTDAAPGAPAVTSDNWDGDGDYSVTANLWWGTNATAYRVFENGELLTAGELVARTPSMQRVIVPIEGRAVGTYAYVIEFENAAGATKSAELRVTVSR